MRGRLPLWHFHNDPGFDTPENIMGYPIDYSKPTFYWGHEFYLLTHLNRNRNKLIFILRDPKENLCSQLIHHYHLDAKNHDQLNQRFFASMKGADIVFDQYMTRLQLYDSWTRKHRLLIDFESLCNKPEVYVPRLLNFLSERIDPTHFIEHFRDFQQELGGKYYKKWKTRGTGAGTNTKHFRKFLSKAASKAFDRKIQKNYPILWERYLKRFAE